MTKSAAEVRREIAKRSQKKGRQPWFSLKAGKKVYLRIGPPWEKGGEFWKDTLTHGYFKDKVYCRKNDINPKTDKPRKCPVCEAVKDLKNDRSMRGRKLWGLIKQGSEGLWNVLVARKFIRKSNGKIIVKRYRDNQFKIFRLSPRWQNLMMDIFGDEDFRTKSILGVTHPRHGRLIKASRTGSGREDTTYAFSPVDRETPIFNTKEKRLEILKTLVNLDNVVRGSSQEECEAFLERMKKRAKRLALMEKEKADEDEDDDLDDADDEEDEEGEEDSDDEEEEDGEDDDMESRYKKIKKEAKRKKHHRDDDDE